MIYLDDIRLIADRIVMDVSDKLNFTEEQGDKLYWDIIESLYEICDQPGFKTNENKNS